MKDDTTTNQSAILTRTHVKTLLTLALENGPASGEDGSLGTRTTHAQQVLDALGRRLGEPCENLLARLASCLLTLDELRATKELAKRLAMKTDTAVEREAAALVYHLSVAAALCRHGEHISGEPLEQRQQVYERLGRLFAGEAVGAIFQQASEWKAPRP